MERESARGAPPTPHTYALILQAWLRFGPESENPVTLSGSIVQDPVALLRNIVRREIAPALVVSDRAFTSSEEATEAIRALSKAALTCLIANRFLRLPVWSHHPYTPSYLFIELLY